MDLATDIRNEANLVETIEVRRRFDLDPDENLVGTVRVWEYDNEILVEVPRFADVVRAA